MKQNETNFSPRNCGTFFTSLYMASLASSEVPKSSVNFYCEKCDYNTCRKSQYERHILTPKHQNASKCYVLTSKKVPINAQKYKILIFPKVNLKKHGRFRGSKVFPKIKNGQKKCPIFKNQNIL